MNIMMILAHPKRDSLNHAAAAAVRDAVRRKGHSLNFHDLYEEGFDPLITAEELKVDFQPEGLLKQHCDEIRKADALIIVHPNYRNQPPAILKGWVDRVIRSGVAFRFEGEEGKEGDLVGMLTARSAIIISTADCPESADAAMGYPLQQFWDRDIFSDCGVGETICMPIYGVLFSTEEERRQWLDSLTLLVESL
jgi:putative NADPH-quinone reductase